MSLQFFFPPHTGALLHCRTIIIFFGACVDCLKWCNEGDLLEKIHFQSTFVCWFNGTVNCPAGYKLHVFTIDIYAIFFERISWWCCGHHLPPSPQWSASSSLSPLSSCWSSYWYNMVGRDRFSQLLPLQLPETISPSCPPSLPNTPDARKRAKTFSHSHPRLSINIMS